jgi:hypothetical protein
MLVNLLSLKAITKQIHGSHFARPYILGYDYTWNNILGGPPAEDVYFLNILFRSLPSIVDVILPMIRFKSHDLPCHFPYF